MREAAFPRQMLHPINRAHPLRIGELVSVVVDPEEEARAVRGHRRGSSKQDDEEPPSIDETGLYQVSGAT